jgi:hypothetical protein
MKMSYLLPNSSIEVEVFQTAESIGLIIRDHSLTTPEFNPVNFLKDVSANVIHQDWMLKEDEPDVGS